MGERGGKMLYKQNMGKHQLSLVICSLELILFHYLRLGLGMKRIYLPRRVIDHQSTGARDKILSPYLSFFKFKKGGGGGGGWLARKKWGSWFWSAVK